MPAREVRDPIHGFIHREEHEQQIIDTALFQRLRRIKQLALAALVYPGALHTRFEHSLGALHVAGRMAEGLRLDGSESRLVRLAALLHDVGHGPFSHVSEPLLERFAQRDKLKWVPEQQVHEALTAQIIRIAPELQGPLGDIEREHIAGLLQGTYGDSILKEIISGPLDVDKQDYLLRDSYFCGVKYGIYDIERLVHALSVGQDKEDRFLAVSSDNVHVLEQFILAKYYMTTQVYRHRIRLITDAMIQRGITLGIERDGIPWLRDLYAYDGSEKYIENYLQWHDERVTTKILDDEKDGFAKDIFRRLADRKLLRRIVSYTPDDFAAEPPEIKKHIFEADGDFRRDLERAVADQYGWDVHLLIVELVRLKSLAHATGSEGEIMILRPDGQRTFQEESALFRAIDKATSAEQHLEVYAPVVYADERDKKWRLGEFRQSIRRMAVKIAEARAPQATTGEQP